MFYADRVKFDENADYSILTSEEAKNILSLFIKGIDGVEDYSRNGITAFMKEIIKESGVSTKQFMQTVRLSLTGKDHGPDIVRVVKIFGKEKCKRFMKAALNL